MYREAVVAFIDILGFKEIVRKKSACEVRGDLTFFEKITKLDPAEHDWEFKPSVIKFSDSIVRIRPFNADESKEKRCDLLFSEMNNLVHIQSELIDRDILVRGGVSTGEVYCEDTTVFGPGVVNAYEMESIYAKYPRIVIDPKLIYQMEDALSSNQYDRDEFSLMIRKGYDGLYFIDYLAAILNEIDSDLKRRQFLEKHKKLILDRTKNNSELSPVSSKYLWMAMYHNEIVEPLCKEAKLVISPKELPLLLHI